jgi:phosphate transport system substrate-binding protein
VAGATNLQVTGSTTIYPLAESAAEVFMKANPGVKIAITSNGSSEGIKAVIEGTADIGSASRDVKLEEAEHAQAKGIALTKNVIALDRIVPVVHPSNPVTNLTVDQLQGTYSGKIRSWNEVGGSADPIVVISRDAESGTFEVWHKLVLKGGEQRSDAVIQASNGAVIQAVASKKNAIGFAYMSPVVKGLKVNGIAASEETARDGTFPVARQLFMFTRGAPTGPIKQFIDFLLSPEAAALPQDEGFVPAVSRMASN